VIRRNPTPGSAAAEALDKRRAERSALKAAKAPPVPSGTSEPETVVNEVVDPKPVRQQPKREPRAKRTSPPKKTT